MLALPSKLQALVAEVETLAQAPVRWECAPGIEGVMCSFIEAGTPIIRYRERSEAGMAEELMHLRLMLFGVRLSYPANRQLVAQTATMLQNVVHHHVIYPVLSEWGYEPSATECMGISKQLLTLEGSPEINRARTDYELAALLAIVYARGQLDCGAPDITSRLDNIFTADSLSNARQMGNQVTSVIRKQTDLSPAGCKGTLGDCLAVLQLSDIISIVGPDA